MSVDSAEEFLGLELDWLGSDVDGSVAIFSTAGGGHVPDEVLRDPDVHAEAIEAILDGQPTTAARFAPEIDPGLINVWKMAAERGIFAFDADIYGGPYVLVAAPVLPVRFDQLIPGVIGVVREIRFGKLRFAALRTVTGGDLREGR